MFHKSLKTLGGAFPVPKTCCSFIILNLIHYATKQVQSWLVQTWYTAVRKPWKDSSYLWHKEREILIPECDVIVVSNWRQRRSERTHSEGGSYVIIDTRYRHRQQNSARRWSQETRLRFMRPSEKTLGLQSGWNAAITTHKAEEHRQAPDLQ